MIKEIDRRIARRLAGIRTAFRGVINLVNAAGQVQLVQLDGLAGETLQQAELFQHYGCTTHPPKGTMAIVLPIGGKTAHGIVIATEHGSYRLKGLKPGEVALYTDEGDSIVLKRGRLAEVTTQTLRVNASELVEFNTKLFKLNASVKTSVTTPMAEFSAQVKVLGLLTGTGGFAFSGGTGGSTGTITGNLTQTGGSITTDGDVVASNISLVNHPHGGVQRGTDLSDGPQ